MNNLNQLLTNLLSC